MHLHLPPKDFQLPLPPGPHLGCCGESYRSFREGEPLVAATYFYWYDKELNLHWRNPDGRDLLTDHPPPNVSFSYRDLNFHYQQFVDMEYAGIDVALLNWWGSPYTNEAFRWVFEGIPIIVAARQKLIAEGKRPPKLGLFYDTCTLGPWANAKGYSFQLRDRQGYLWFYGTIRDFFSLIPPEHRATIDGQPVVFVYSLTFAQGVDEGTLPFARKEFRHDFGSDLFLVTMRDNLLWHLKGDPRVVEKTDELMSGKLTDLEVLVELMTDSAAISLAGNSRIGRARRTAIKLKGKLFLKGKWFPLFDPIYADFLKLFWRHRGTEAQIKDNLVTYFSSASAGRAFYDQWLRDFARMTGLTSEARAKRAELVVDYCRSQSHRRYLDAFSTFLQSDVHFAACGNDEEVLVTSIFQKVLARNPSAEEKLHWLDQCKRKNRRDAVAELSREREFVLSVFAWWHHFYLGTDYCGNANSEYQWGGALEPQFFDTVAIGPGFDDSAVPERQVAIVSRENGNFYKRSWEKILQLRPRPWLIHLETWNEFHEATELCESAEYGRSYIELTRQFSQRFHQGSR